MRKQVRVFYSGRVQGVGFRFTVESIANDFGVLGWIKNMRDGRVELLAEAEEPVLTDFLTKIGKSFANYINHTEVDWQAARGDFRDFRIEFS